MADTKSSSASTSVATGNTAASQAAEQVRNALAQSDTQVTQQVQGLGLVQRARLAQNTRTAAALLAQYGATDSRVIAAQAAVMAGKTTVARIAIVGQQLAAPVVDVSKTGWVLQGQVLDAQLQPAAKFTVFLVDGNKRFLQQFGFAYTDDTGFYKLSYAGDNAPAGTKQPVPAQLYVEVVNTDANPVYLSSSVFTPMLGAASFQNIVLPADGQPIGDPPDEIRAVALPRKGASSK